MQIDIKLNGLDIKFHRCWYSVTSGFTQELPLVSLTPSETHVSQMVTRISQESVSIFIFYTKMRAAGFSETLVATLKVL
jgi:hypothetical protein